MTNASMKYFECLLVERFRQEQGEHGGHQGERAEDHEGDQFRRLLVDLAAPEQYLRGEERADAAPEGARAHRHRPDHRGEQLGGVDEDRAETGDNRGLA